MANRVVYRYIASRQMDNNCLLKKKEFVNKIRRIKHEVNYFLYVLQEIVTLSLPLIFYFFLRFTKHQFFFHWVDLNLQKDDLFSKNWLKLLLSMLLCMLDNFR